MNRVDIVKVKFPDHFDSALKVTDPSGDKHKYLFWIANQLANGHKPEDISPTIKYFDSNIDKFAIKDIYKYVDLKEIEDLIKEFGLPKRQIKEQDKTGAEKILENENLIVVRVDSKSAMIIYGANTRWCTTMQNQSYYEDYVCQGNYFYIVISKNPNVLASPKYAIVRKGLLEFSVYDAQDNFARSFSEIEEDTLRDALVAIISDKPPVNYIKLIIEGNVPTLEAAEWLKLQTNITREYVESKCPSLRFLSKTTDELIKLLSQQFHYIDKIDPTQRLEVLEILKNSKDKNHFFLKMNLLDHLDIEDKLKLTKDNDSRVRAKAVMGLDADTAKDFFTDKSMQVFKAAARKVDVSFLLKSTYSSRSSKKRQIAHEVIIERLSQERVKEFILNQPLEVIASLMD